MQRISKDDGFTLIEMLLVLCIISVISSFVWINISRAYESKKIEHFIEQFYIDLLYAQEYAMSHHRDMKVHLLDGYYEIKGSFYNDPTVLKRTYDKDIQIDVMTLRNPIVFNDSGNIERPGSLFVRYKDVRFMVMFQLGRGRIYYEEIK